MPAISRVDGKQGPQYGEGRVDTLPQPKPPPETVRERPATKSKFGRNALIGGLAAAIGLGAWLYRAEIKDAGAGAYESVKSAVATEKAQPTVEKPKDGVQREYGFTYKVLPEKASPKTTAEGAARKKELSELLSKGVFASDGHTFMAFKVNGDQILGGRIKYSKDPVPGWIGEVKEGRIDETGATFRMVYGNLGGIGKGWSCKLVYGPQGMDLVMDNFTTHLNFRVQQIGEKVE